MPEKSPDNAFSNIISEQNFRGPLDKAPFPIMVHAEDGEVLLINAIWREITGYTHQDIPTTKAWAQRAYGERAGKVLENIIAKKYTLKSRWSEGEFKIATSRGRQRLWQFSSAPLGQLPDGRRVVISMAADITELREAEIALRSSEARWQFALEGTGEGVWDWNLQTNKVFYSRQWKLMQGYDEDEVGNSIDEWLSRVDPDDLPQCYGDLFKHFSGETLIYENEHRLRCKDGSYKWILARGKVMEWGANGQPLRIIGTHSDISSRKQAERALRESEKRFRNMAANVPGAILRYVLHPDGSDAVIYMSPGCYNLWEIEPDAVVKDAQILWDLIFPEERSSMYESVLASARTLEPWFWQWRITTPSGQVKWLEAAGRPERQDNGDVVWDTLIIDVSDRKRAEAALHKSEERLRLVTENMSDLVCLHDRDGSYLYVTSSSETLLGYTPEELMGGDPRELIHPDDRERVCLEAQELVARGLISPITYRLRKKTGEYIWLETLIKVILDESGQIRHLQSTSRDVSDRVRVEEQLKHDALHDGLTSLPNRSLLMERLENALKRAQRDREYKFAVLFLDLDNFKVVNDSLGHLFGDKLLLAVATELKKLIGETDLAARLGGDEFVILLSELEEIEETELVAERILSRLGWPLQVGKREIFISASIGIVLGTNSYHRAEDLLRDADLAMYRAKENGRGGYAIFDPPMHLQVVQRMALEHDLRKALENREFVLYYQPVVNLKTQLIRGLEALIRWQHPQRGFVSPGEFIPIAEETGLIEPIGRWVLQSACEQLATWQAQFPDQFLRMSINLSVKQLQGMLLPQLDEILNKCGLQGHSLVLEITESMLVSNVESTRKLLESIEAKGIDLSIDDFGTGYSSLSYLHQLPVSNLKIDRAFVSPKQPDTRNQVIAEAIIALSNLLELKTIAEGIETRQQLQWLKELGCELGQGFLFSPPVPAPQVTELLQRPLVL